MRATSRKLPILDRLNRPLRDLRLSVTDRCNFRCRYCMPRQNFGPGHSFLPRSDLLTFEEITRVVALLAGLGVRKVRLTGGEPLLRKDVSSLVARLVQISAIEVVLTTNGSRLAAGADALASAGLQRVTVSLDALGEAVFRRMSDADCSVSHVLAGIERAAQSGLPIKINMLVQRGMNDHESVDLARHFRFTGHVLRFIEYMPVGGTNGWQPSEVVSAEEIIATVARVFPLRALEPACRGEVARRWRYADGAGEIGVIASVTQPFCSDCTRIRLTADGRLFTCLFANRGLDLRLLLRRGAVDEELLGAIQDLWRARAERTSELRERGKCPASSVEMSYLGG